jgi:hypothetical protein
MISRLGKLVIYTLLFLTVRRIAVNIEVRQVQKIINTSFFLPIHDMVHNYLIIFTHGNVIPESLKIEKKHIILEE